MDIFSQEIIWKLKEIAGIRPIQILNLSQLWKSLRNQHRWSKSALFLHKNLREKIQPVLHDIVDLTVEVKIKIIFCASSRLDDRLKSMVSTAEYDEGGRIQRIRIGNEMLEGSHDGKLKNSFRRAKEAEAEQQERERRQ
ncbi:hypothetical protein CRE_29651 [Caenorhabditis remanei]|uniref:SPK domain-containing protein n=1 Tax=Caenorhabditis remanei TaxID=31234 RepID=E3LV00_CAERE|nr:hypothetical protein CRE_29651 [Caenorhabditis remanei]